MKTTRAVFFISDRTNITAENLGNSLLNQFNGIEFECTTFPFVNSGAQAKKLLQQILQLAHERNEKVIVFSSLVNAELRPIFDYHDAIFHVDFFNTFIPPLEKILQKKSNRHES